MNFLSSMALEAKGGMVMNKAVLTLLASLPSHSSRSGPSLSPYAVIYDLSADFSFTNNPNGVWAYE